MATLVAARAATGLVTVPAPSASASVFWEPGRWDVDDETGHVIVPVCIHHHSETVEFHPEDNGDSKEGDPPDLDVVVGQLRDHLRWSWERFSNARFVGWQSCDADDVTLEETVELYIHPEAPNVAILGTGAMDGRIEDEDGNPVPEAKGEANVKPWGRSQQCIVPDPDAGFRYEFDCVQQYGIHELGHVLGFAHEWLHPATPAGCASVTPSGERPIAPGDPDYTITEAGFDFESLMTYNHGDNEECAAVTGVRFGSPNLSLGDRVGAQLVYPVLEDDPQGDDAVGVIPDRAGTCPATTEVVIYLDNENDGNANARSGHIGAFVSDTDTRMEFCKVSAAGFRRAAGSVATASYAVLRLGERCPTGSIPVARTHDDEDDWNQGWMAGETGPQVQTNNTTIWWCLFMGTGTASGLTRFPRQTFEYGVLGVSGPTWAREAGWVTTDDEATANVNEFFPPPSPGSDLDKALDAVIPVRGRGTTRYNIVGVWVNQPPLVDVPTSVEVDEGDRREIVATAVDPDGDAVTWEWTSDGEVLSSGPTVEVGYDDDGTHTLTVTATDANGASVSRDVTVTVENVAPMLAPPASPAPIDEGEVAVLELVATDPGADTITYTVEWSPGVETTHVGAPSEPIEASHRYPDDNGSAYVVQVHAVDDDGGASETWSVPIEVRNVAPSVEIDAPPVEEGEVLAVDVTVTDPGADGHTILFHWPDGEVVSRSVPKDAHGPSYTERFEKLVRDDPAGPDDTMPVSVTVRDDDSGTGSVTAAVTVRNVAPELRVMPDQLGMHEGTHFGLTMEVDDQGPDDRIEGFVDWGDGTSEVLAPDLRGTVEIWHAYGDDGFYTPTITVIDDDGGVTVDAVEVAALNFPPTATVTRLRQPAEVDIGDLGDADVVFTDVPLNIGADVSDPGWLDVLSYRVDWGDGSWRTGSPVDNSIDTSRAYQSPGDRTITLTVTDDDGGSSVVTRSVRVVDPVGGLVDAADDLEALLASGVLSSAAASEVEAAIDDLEGTGTGIFGRGAIDLLSAGDHVGGANKVVAATEHLVAAGPVTHRTAMQLAVAVRSLAVDRLQSSSASSATISAAKQSIGKGTNQLRAQLPLGAAKRYRDAVRTLQSLF